MSGSIKKWHILILHTRPDKKNASLDLTQQVAAPYHTHSLTCCTRYHFVLSGFTRVYSNKPMSVSQSVSKSLNLQGCNNWCQERNTGFQFRTNIDWSDSICPFFILHKLFWPAYQRQGGGGCLWMITLQSFVELFVNVYKMWDLFWSPDGLL